MHELSVALSIISVVREKLPPGHAVKQLEIELGSLASINREQLRFCLNIAGGKELKDAKIVFKEKEAVFRCNACGREHRSKEVISTCEHCGSALSFVDGGGVVVKRMVVECIR